MSEDNTVVTPEPQGKEDIIELLGEEETPEVLDLTKSSKIPVKEKEEKDEEDDETEEEVDELEELEKELEGPKDEDLELMTPVRRKEILAKYPDLFKTFPYLEKAYYRDQKFTELLPTIEDAQKAVEKAQILDGFENIVVKGGDISIVLQAAREDNPETFNRMVDNYLPSLKKADVNAYYHVLGNVIKDTIVTMVRESRAQGEQGQPLAAAANILNQFIFGSSNFQPSAPLARQIPQQEQNQLNEVQQREQALFQQQFVQVRDELQSKADNTLKATIDANIDPHKTMSDYVRRNACREVKETLDSLMTKDARFHSLLDKLWEKAFQAKFSKPTTDAIKSAYLSKARTLLPSVIKKARNEALKGSGHRTNDSSNDSSESKKGPITPGRPTTNSGKIRKASDIPKGMKTLDFLMQD